ncbi:type IV-A pilus assembly ATPase PilB [Thermomonas sp.]|jgi:type IV pilus assembly protein PilB|uniref:type IV-A pilus assembly ATPase PilB n=2 Tax=Thermomonas sp. TaxID=1971895 RepID=UPI001B7ABF34|nr:type IV-A pilus assembly ATPase PilB [Thermomonas sp.]MBP6853938.1 type IV-A pilus assembly ATPase PilB [Rhodoferax sp.]MBK6416222.1 type IV-A pilus assembly ATPase PilB [Thermomonas sp.]MBK6925376.1 type IV-A pilus assembly ATPase PilB [Thermomonas sp.]MBK9669537.1 type IV-A pilus assembly ATPase PilB [Thermomonas sp.]MBL0228057.1 type IV-A pilus assembly ATPase PilB [Thermomonas sp.]
MSAAVSANLMGITGIARRLVLDGAMDEASARKAMEAATGERVPLATFIADRKLVQPAALAAAHSLEFGMPLVDPLAIDPAQSAIALVKEELLRKHQVLPLFKRGSRLFVGIADPTDNRALEELKFHTNLTVEPILVDADRIRRCLDLWLEAAESMADAVADAEGLDGLDVSSGDDELVADSGIDAKGEDTPVVKFVNKALVDAIRKGASDIHFEPYETEYRVRFRIDGILKTAKKVPVKLHARIAARLKVMSQLDIAEKRIPQDGRIKLNLSKTKQIDFRVSTLPTLFGEKVVLRILDGSAAKLGIEKLGYEPDQQKLFVDAVQKPYGMVLVTGPTGSGKTVSLYTALNILNDEQRNISTVEDPVEIRVPGINQVQMNAKRGMTFAAALRSFLRQDPDVLMVGEIRDLETAEIAIKAAQTGHMVLSTLHTNDAPQTVARLMNMGVAPYNITSSVSLIIAQRLARRLHDCKRAVHLPEHALLAEGYTADEVHAGITTFEAVGCEDCTEGYKGRVGIYQVMPMTEAIQQIVLAGGNVQQITDAALGSGVRDLRRSALDKVKSGVTSLIEINRVTKD